MSIGDLIAIATWTLIALVIRRESKPKDPWKQLARDARVRDRRRSA